MFTIHTLLQRIRWVAEFGHAGFTIGYLGRVTHRLVTLPFERIERAIGAAPSLGRAAGRRRDAARASSPGAGRWREALALVGVLVASVLPSVAGLSAAMPVFAIGFAASVAQLARAPRPHLGQHCHCACHMVILTV